MVDTLNTLGEDGGIHIIRVVTSSGPRLTRPRHIFRKKEAFIRRLIKKGNTIYTANTFTMNIPCADGAASIDMAEHLNGGVMKITYNGVDFAAPSMSAIGMGTSVVFDLHEDESACQRKFCETGCRDVALRDEISDIAADKKSCMITTALISESTPGEPMYDHPRKLMNLNSVFVSDIAHTKKLQLVAPGVLDYYVRVNIPALYSHGTVEVLSCTFMNDILIQLAKTGGGWEVMKNTYDASTTPGFVIAKSPTIAMGISLMDWPRGAICLPPDIRYKEFENVNRWGVYQNLGSRKHNAMKIPGGEYSWKIRLFFGPIWFIQQHINKIHPRKHGNEHKKLYYDDFHERQAKTRHEYAYDYS